MEAGEVQKVASLARLRLTDGECMAFGKQLTAILDYVRLLDEVDTTGVAPMPHAVELQNVFREDRRQQSLDRQAALSNSPQTDDRFFLVPRILEAKK